MTLTGIRGTNLWRAVENRLKIFHSFRRAGNSESTLNPRRRLLQMRAATSKRERSFSRKTYLKNSPLGNDDRHITPHVHPSAPRRSLSRRPGRRGLMPRRADRDRSVDQRHFQLFPKDDVALFLFRSTWLTLQRRSAGRSRYGRSPRLFGRCVDRGFFPDGRSARKVVPPRF